MTEQPTNPSPADGVSRPSDPASRRARNHPELRVAVSSAGSGPPAWWAWVLTLSLIFAGGAALYAARSAIAPALDRWLPAPTQTPEEVPVADPEPVVEVAPEVEESSEPQWTFGDIESAIVPLPERIEALIAEGRNELSQFRGLNARDETQALLARNRWRLWGRIWLNRVAQIRTEMPPLLACEPHAELQPTCEALVASLALLDRVPRTQVLDEDRESFAEAAWVLATYQGPPRSSAP